MPSKAITDPDERQSSPAVMARQVGWSKPPGQIGWSWDALLRQAEFRYYANRYRRPVEDVA